MSNKINATYWGAENTYITITNRSFKVPDWMYPDVISNHSELLNSSYDKSVMIWGIPSDSSAGSTTVFSWWWDSATETGKIKSEIFSPNIYTFSPATITSDDYRIDYWYAKGTSPSIDGINILQRTKPDTSIISTSVVSTQVASGQYVGSTHKLRVQKTTGSNYDYLLNTQVTYFPYNLNVFRAFASLSALDFKTNAHTIHTFRTSDLSTDFDTIFDAVKTDAGSTGMTDDDVTVIGAGFMCYDTTNINNNRSNHAAANPHITVTTGIEYSDRANNISCNGAEKQKFMSFGRNDYIGYGAFISNLTKQNCDIIGLPAGSVGVPKENKYFNDSTSYENGYGKFTDGFIRVSRKHQLFSDVAYHWEIGITINGKIYNIEDSETITLENMQAPFNISSIIPYMVIDDDKGETRRNALRRAVMHELAFFGVAFCTSHSIAINERWNSSSENIYIPLFDEHMCTTGEYVTLKQAYTANLPQSQWGDVFGAQEIIDNYDPDYQPEPPGPEPEEGDTGDLYNQGARRFFWNSLNVHLMSVANYDQFIQKLNALNMTDPDNETWQLQFKGLNPSDYIVGAYVSFVKPPKGTSSTIMLGPVDIEQTEYTYKETDSNAGFFSFGTKDILPKFNDFRDYAPYTTIEVYLPLCGTVEVDTAYFMDCSMKIDYYYDIYTMSCVACIYRVKAGQELLYKTVSGTIGAQIPMLSANMGAYQNQIKSIENALKQNELKLMTSTAALAAGVIAAPMTSGTSLIAAGTAAFSGAAGLANSMQKQSELEYQIEHIQPSISVTGAADPQTNLCTGQLMPKIIIKRAKMLTTYNQEEYAKTIGHACCINDTLGYVEGDTETPRTGLVVCSSVDTSGIIQMISESDYISPTADEVNMIKQALSSGVIL